MTAMHLQHPTARSGKLRRHDALDALNDAGDWAFTTLREWHQRIRERRQLAGLNDRMLRDIGLCPAERDFLANKPFWRE